MLLEKTVSGWMMYTFMLQYNKSLSLELNMNQNGMNSFILPVCTVGYTGPGTTWANAIYFDRNHVPGVGSVN